MTNTLKLKGKIMEKGMTIQSLADEMNITSVALSSKINNKSEFRVSEINTIVAKLQLSNQEILSIFFAQESDCKTQKG